MRILGIGEYCDLGDMYWRLQQRGHEVRAHIELPQCADVFGGMLQTVADWRAELGWVRAAGAQGLVLFESACKGALQDALRADGFQVIGGSAYGDRLEADRAFGQRELAGFGLRCAPTHAFTSHDAAIDFIRSRPGRYVLKGNGGDTERFRNYIGELDSGADVLALLELHRRQSRGAACDFVLMDHVQGVEVGVGAYFDGARFLRPACIDFEHKRFFPGDLGELTGEMGTIVSYRGAQRIFEASLGRMAAKLRDGGYVGYINLNLIANAQGLWPLEFTSRFGYPGFAICEALHAQPWEAIFRKMLAREPQGAADIATREGFAAGVVLSVPPFPYAHGYAQLSKGAPVTFREGTTAADRDAIHFAEVAMDQGQLVASGSTGYIGCVTGVGATVEAARDAAYGVARKVVMPNLRYRSDIGDRVTGPHGALERLRAWGWWTE